MFVTSHDGVVRDLSNRGRKLKERKKEKMCFGRKQFSIATSKYVFLLLVLELTIVLLCLFQ